MQTPDFVLEMRMNILLVDDDEVIRMGMRKLIDRSGKDWSVCGEASDGNAGARDQSRSYHM